ncbi:hypothetical protein JTE90_027291 [Oedothorax gibbosus]|uniref:Uncharacterized protein n=1 Tax=Oedothorax gibbosus TaxID=931172 RepID=A0AAV6VYU2_9ARAC|nr:hypothetical protein JTE90_027291 [Oedothorax gibbosus]
MQNENEGRERDASRELCSNDRNSSGDSRAIQESIPFETVPFVKNSNSPEDSSSSEDLDPHVYVAMRFMP